MEDLRHETHARRTQGVVIRHIDVELEVASLVARVLGALRTRRTDGGGSERMRIGRGGAIRVTEGSPAASPSNGRCSSHSAIARCPPARRCPCAETPSAPARGVVVRGKTNRRCQPTLRDAFVLASPSRERERGCPRALTRNRRVLAAVIASSPHPARGERRSASRCAGLQFAAPRAGRSSYLKARSRSSGIGIEGWHKIRANSASNSYLPGRCCPLIK